jgi:hypothetical protein
MRLFFTAEPRVKVEVRSAHIGNESRSKNTMMNQICIYVFRSAKMYLTAVSYETLWSVGRSKGIPIHVSEQLAPNTSCPIAPHVIPAGNIPVCEDNKMYICFSGLDGTESVCMIKDGKGRPYFYNLADGGILVELDTLCPERRYILLDGKTAKYVNGGTPSQPRYLYPCLRTNVWDVSQKSVVMHVVNGLSCLAATLLQHQHSSKLRKFVTGEFALIDKACDGKDYVYIDDKTTARVIMHAYHAVCRAADGTIFRYPIPLSKAGQEAPAACFNDLARRPDRPAPAPVPLMANQLPLAVIPPTAPVTMAAEAVVVRPNPIAFPGSVSGAPIPPVDPYQRIPYRPTNQNPPPSNQPVVLPTAPAIGRLESPTVVPSMEQSQQSDLDLVAAPAPMDEDEDESEGSEESEEEEPEESVSSEESEEEFDE